MDNFDIMKKLRNSDEKVEENIIEAKEEKEQESQKIIKKPKKKRKKRKFKLPKFNFPKITFKFRKPKLPKITLTSNSTYIIIGLIVGFSYIYVEKMKINNANNLKIQQEAKRLLQVDAYNSCMKDAEVDYTYNWNRACQSLKKRNDCGLPNYRAQRIEEWRKQAEKTCLQKLENNAFEFLDIN